MLNVNNWRVFIRSGKNCGERRSPISARGILTGPLLRLSTRPRQGNPDPSLLQHRTNRAREQSGVVASARIPGLFWDARVRHWARQCPLLELPFNSIIAVTEHPGVEAAIA